MRLQIVHRLPFVGLSIEYGGRKLFIPRVLVDTGSASTVLSADVLDAVHIRPRSDDLLRRIRGVGGGEIVFTREVDSIQVGEMVMHNYRIDVGGMDYGFEINGILGMDFLSVTKAVIDLAAMELRFG
ncbi:MAG TPA: hypothetical protein G4N94_06075 [Caldilineae bacterium]|nr:hypothetical protein [Caldilineae bacterium]